MKNIFLSALAGLLLLGACRQVSKDAASTGNQLAEKQSLTAAEAPADFQVFYEKFHADSLFQIAHISWPLSGETAVQRDSTAIEKKATTWMLENWRMHRPVDFSTGEFKREWQPLGDAMIIERIRYKAANFGLERRFAKQNNGDWELIYYSDMHEMGK